MNHGNTPSNNVQNPISSKDLKITSRKLDWINAAPTFSSAAKSTDGTKIILTYNENLDSSNVPSTSDFALTIAGSSNSISAVSIYGREVTLTVGTTIKNDEAVTVANSDPTSGNDTNEFRE